MLFIIYINDTKKLKFRGNIRVFATDTALIFAGHSEVAFENYNHDMKLLQNCFKENGLQLNPSNVLQ